MKFTPSAEKWLEGFPPAMVTYWYRKDGKLIHTSKLLEAIREGDDSFYMLGCTGSIWSVGESITSIMMSFVDTKTEEISIFEKDFCYEMNFIYEWEFIPVERNFVEKFMKYKNMKYILSYKIKNSMAVFEKRKRNKKTTEKFLWALENQRFDEVDRILDQL